MRGFLNKLARDRDGGTLAVFAIALPLMIGAVVLSIETGYLNKTKSDLQITSDLAAYAGAKDLQFYTNSQAITAAKLDALQNGFDF